MDYFYQTLGLSDNQDGHQNGCHISVYTCGHSNLVIYHPISSKFHIWTTFIKELFMSEYGFCQMNDYQDFRQNGYLCIRRGPLSESDCSNLIRVQAPPTNVGRALLFSACPSVRGHSNSVIFNQIFFQISYMDCFHQPLVHIRKRVLSDI